MAKLCMCVKIICGTCTVYLNYGACHNADSTYTLILHWNILECAF